MAVTRAFLKVFIELPKNNSDEPQRPHRHSMFHNNDEYHANLPATSGHEFCTVPITNFTTASQVCQIVARKRNLRYNSDDYVLAMVDGNTHGSFDRTLDNDDIPFDYQTSAATYGHLGNFHFVFRKIINPHKYRNQSLSKTCETNDNNNNNNNNQSQLQSPNHNQNHAIYDSSYSATASSLGDNNNTSNNNSGSSHSSNGNNKTVSFAENLEINENDMKKNNEKKTRQMFDDNDDYNDTDNNNDNEDDIFYNHKIKKAQTGRASNNGQNNKYWLTESPSQSRNSRNSSVSRKSTGGSGLLKSMTNKSSNANDDNENEDDDDLSQSDSESNPIFQPTNAKSRRKGSQTNYPTIWMEKRGKNHRAWRRRYFVLMDDELLYFKRKELYLQGKNPIARIQLAKPPAIIKILQNNHQMLSNIGMNHELTYDSSLYNLNESEYSHHNRNYHTPNIKSVSSHSRVTQSWNGYRPNTNISTNYNNRNDSNYSNNNEIKPNIGGNNSNDNNNNNHLFHTWYYFDIHTPKRIFSLRIDNYTDLIKWVSLLQRRNEANQLIDGLDELISNSEKMHGDDDDLVIDYFSNVDSIFEDHLATDVYLRYLTQQHNENFLHFWLDLQRFEQQFNRFKPSLKLRFANELFEKYIKPNSKHELGEIQFRERKNIMNLIDKEDISQNMFDNIKQSVYAHLKREANHFFNSSDYVEFLITLNRDEIDNVTKSILKKQGKNNNQEIDNENEMDSRTEMKNEKMTKIRLSDDEPIIIDNCDKYCWQSDFSKIILSQPLPSEKYNRLFGDSRNGFGTSIHGHSAISPLHTPVLHHTRASTRSFILNKKSTSPVFARAMRGASMATTQTNKNHNSNNDKTNKSNNYSNTPDGLSRPKRSRRFGSQSVFADAPGRN